MNNLTNESKQKKTNRLIILGLIIAVSFCAIAGGFIYAKARSEKDVLVTPDKKEEQRAPKTVISLLDESIEAQRQVDNILLSKDNWQLVEEDRVEKLKKVENSAARVKISQRELNVGIPSSSSIRGAAEWLTNRLQGKGIYVISQEFVKERSYIGYELQLGIKVKAGDGSRLFNTDKIIFLYNDNLTVPDRDVKDYPDEEPKKRPKKAVVDEDEIVERSSPEKKNIKSAGKNVADAQDAEEDDEEEIAEAGSDADKEEEEEASVNEEASDTGREDSEE